MTSIIKSKDMVVDTITKANTTVSASGYAEVTIDATKSGYTPIGVVGINKTGGSSVYCVPSTFYIDNGTFHMYLRNTSTSSATVTVVVSVLYQKA